MHTHKIVSRTLATTCLALLTGLGLAACDPADTAEPLADAEQFADDEQPAADPLDGAPDTLAAADEQDPEEAGLLCVLCVLGGHHPVCGDDGVTYGNACWAHCHDAAVEHTGACVDEPACPAGAVDQQNLGPSGGSLELNNTVVVGQTFTAGVTGQLTGIELALYEYCFQPLVRTSVDIQLSLYDDADALLATATIPATALPATCGGPDFGAGTCSATVFDLSAAGVDVTVGQQLRAEVVVLSTPPNCEADVCTGGNTGAACADENDFDCVPFAAVEVSNNLYAGGAAYTPDTPGLVADLFFKTFVD